MCSSESDGTGDRRQQETVGRRRDKAKRQRKQTKQNVAQVPLHFSFHFSLFFCGSQTLGRALTHQHTHTHTDARTVGQWKQCINMISRTTAEQSRAESRELMPFPGHGLRLELELGHGKVIGRCPDRLLAGHMAPPPPPPQHRLHHRQQQQQRQRQHSTNSWCNPRACARYKIQFKRYSLTLGVVEQVPCEFCAVAWATLRKCS